MATRPFGIDEPIFVLQHHRASRVHFDFRLEHAGILWSWAVPKGPSCRPSVKRLAVRVEDHPLAYASFEGRIPAGSYGAGEVLVWDFGRWTPHADDVDAAVARGHLGFDLAGRRLGGGWALDRLRDDDWLLVKERDTAACDDGPDLTERFSGSVLTGRSFDDIATDPDAAVWTGDDVH